MAKRVLATAAISLLLVGSTSAFAGASLLSLAEGQNASGATGSMPATQGICQIGASKTLASGGAESCVPIDQITCGGDTSQVGLPSGKDFALPNGTRIAFPNGSSVTLPATSKVLLRQGSMIQLPSSNACALARPAPPEVGGGLSFWQSGILGLTVAGGTTAAVRARGRPFSP